MSRRGLIATTGNMLWLRWVSRALVGCVCALCVIYIATTLVLHVPVVQRKMGDLAATQLGELLGTEVSVGRVDWGFLNRIIIDDFAMRDREQRPLLRVSRMAVSVDLAALSRGRIDITTVQLFGAKLTLSKPTQEAPLNCQFVLDALSSSDDEDESPPDVRLAVRTLLVRGCTVRYDVADAQEKPGQFDVNHLHLEDIALTAAIDLRGLTPIPAGSIDVKRFSFVEAHSGLALTNLRFGVEIGDGEDVRPGAQAGEQVWQVQVSPIRLSTRQSAIETGALRFELSTDSLKMLSAEGTILPSTLGGEDLQRFGLSGVPDLHLQTDRITLTQEGSWAIDGCSVQAGGAADPALTLLANISLALTPQLTVSADGIRMQTNSQHLCQQLSPWGLTSLETTPLAHLGDMMLTGELTVQGDSCGADFSLQTDVGEVSMQASYCQALTGSLHGENIQLGHLLQSTDWGSATFDAQVRQMSLAAGELPSGNLQATVEDLQFREYVYPAIGLQANSDGGEAMVTLSVGGDENISLSLQAAVQRSAAAWEGGLKAVVRELNPFALNLTDAYPEEHFSGTLEAQLRAPDLAHVTGMVRVDSLAIRTPEEAFHLAELVLESQLEDDGMRRTELVGDFIDATLLSYGPPAAIRDAILRQTADWMPNAMDWASASSPPRGAKETASGSFALQARLTDSAILRHLSGKDIRLTGPLTLVANLTAKESGDLALEANGIQAADGTRYEGVNLVLEGDSAGVAIEASASRHNTAGGHTYAQLQAYAHADSLHTSLSLQQHGEANVAATLTSLTHFGNASDSLGRIQVSLQPSQLTVNDTVWRISPATIAIGQGHIAVHDLTIASIYGDRFLTVDGTVSDHGGDSLIADLGGIQVEYVLDLVDFHAVGFKGSASGRAIMHGFTSGMPNFSAHLQVDGFCLESANLGIADIHALWDYALPGVRIDAHIVDDSDTALVRITDCSGYVAPSSDDIQLKVSAQHTNAAFLGDYLGSIFRDVSGEANGVLNVVGPLGEINLVGDMSADVQMTLIPTGVTYHINPHDSLRLRPYKFDFNAVRISDDGGGEGVVNGWVTHRNVKNFAYQFDISMDHLTAYEEHEFNADKFMGKVTLDGSLNIRGSDGHPLYINADCTPRKGSFFAYDAASPDAITGGSFITFTTAADSLSESIAVDPVSLYEGDIFMDMAIHLNPDCDIRLRMDNTDDGYISTQGTGELQAHYHNKSPFTLQGTYNIQSGSYRLYLQEIIYRDLALQSGSSVVFNGNPFDADIHLICHHTLPAVPLSDLTADASVTSTGRAKVICILDITGKLGDMALDFDFELPNETEETKQLVRSLVYTPEERNMQMVYLLALGRFYSSEYARAYGQNANAQAVNNLLASTVSGQINQMLSAVIGTESNWHFGTGISTGDNGLEDLDVEGILSGRLFDDRLLINGNFGYRDNALTQNASFIGDFDLQWRLTPGGNTYVKAYNKANDRYFTKSSLNTQGIGISYQIDFDTWRSLFTRKRGRRTL